MGSQKLIFGSKAQLKNDHRAIARAKPIAVWLTSVSGAPSIRAAVGCEAPHGSRVPARASGTFSKLQAALELGRSKRRSPQELALLSVCTFSKEPSELKV